MQRLVETFGPPPTSPRSPRSPPSSAAPPVGGLPPKLSRKQSLFLRKSHLQDDLDDFAARLFDAPEHVRRASFVTDFFRPRETDSQHAELVGLSRQQQQVGTPRQSSESASTRVDPGAARRPRLNSKASAPDLRKERGGAFPFGLGFGGSFGDLEFDEGQAPPPVPPLPATISALKRTHLAPFSSASSDEMDLSPSRDSLHSISTSSTSSSITIKASGSCASPASTSPPGTTGRIPSPLATNAESARSLKPFLLGRGLPSLPTTPSQEAPEAGEAPRDRKRSNPLRHFRSLGDLRSSAKSSPAIASQPKHEEPMPTNSADMVRAASSQAAPRAGKSSNYDTIRGPPGPPPRMPPPAAPTMMRSSSEQPAAARRPPLTPLMTEGSVSRRSSSDSRSDSSSSLPARVPFPRQDESAFSPVSPASPPPSQQAFAPFCQGPYGRVETYTPPEAFRYGARSSYERRRSSNKLSASKGSSARHSPSPSIESTGAYSSSDMSRTTTSSSYAGGNGRVGTTSDGQGWRSHRSSGDFSELGSSQGMPATPPTPYSIDMMPAGDRSSRKGSMDSRKGSLEAPNGLPAPTWTRSNVPPPPFFPVPPSMSSVAMQTTQSDSSTLPNASYFHRRGHSGGSAGSTGSASRRRAQLTPHYLETILGSPQGPAKSGATTPTPPSPPTEALKSPVPSIVSTVPDSPATPSCADPSAPLPSILTYKVSFGSSIIALRASRDIKLEALRSHIARKFNQHEVAVRDTWALAHVASLRVRDSVPVTLELVDSDAALAAVIARLGPANRISFRVVA